MSHKAGWLILLSLCGIAIGVLRSQVTLAVLSMSVFLWLISLWCILLFKAYYRLGRVRFERHINGRNLENDTLWVGRPAEVKVTASSSSPLPTDLKVRDVLPEILRPSPSMVDARGYDTNSGTRLKGTARKTRTGRLWNWLTHLGTPESRDLSVDSGNQWTIEVAQRNHERTYYVFPQAAGQAQLPGLRLTLSDRFGLFAIEKFADLNHQIAVLPDYYHRGERQPIVKRFNSLPSHGIHRLQRSGVGSELLELREYVPGDPPKSIAWKVSARRDILMTRQYESEVPVRVHLIIDGTVATRIGGFGARLIDQFNFVAASVAKTALSVGDPVTAVLVRESQAKRLNWFSGDMGLLRLLKELAQFSHLPPPESATLTPKLVEHVVAALTERRPELLDRRYLRTPFSFFGSTRERYRLAGALAEIFQLSPMQQVTLYRDDDLLCHFMTRYLHDVGTPWMEPLFSAFATSQNVDTLGLGGHGIASISSALTKSIAHAKDNEVFVILADLPTSNSVLQPFMRAVKLAIAKHHRVAVVCPSSTGQRPDKNTVIRANSTQVEDLLIASEKIRVRDLATRTRKELSKLGVAVAFAGELSAIQVVLSEIEGARDGRSIQGVFA